MLLCLGVSPDSGWVWGLWDCFCLFLRVSAEICVLQCIDIALFFTFLGVFWIFGDFPVAGPAGSH
jgi:hypothetical protein